MVDHEALAGTRLHAEGVHACARCSRDTRLVLRPVSRPASDTTTLLLLAHPPISAACEAVGEKSASGSGSVPSLVLGTLPPRALWRRQRLGTKDSASQAGKHETFGAFSGYFRGICVLRWGPVAREERGGGTRGTAAALSRRTWGAAARSTEGC